MLILSTTLSHTGRKTLLLRPAQVGKNPKICAYFFPKKAYMFAPSFFLFTLQNIFL
jgi:hypothetical protein